jgi:hypothetical protein
MRKFSKTPAKKLKIEMILRDLHARDLVKHVGVSASLIDKLMTGRLSAVSPTMARRINGFFEKRIFPVRVVKKTRPGHLSGEALSDNAELQIKIATQYDGAGAKAPLK